MRFNSNILKIAKNDLTVALSMGIDSLAIIHFLKTKFPKINVKAFHFNHNLRVQNTTMEQSAKRFCEEYNIQLITKHRSHSDTDLSEAGLRVARYKAMSNLGVVVTGHHLDDAVENYLFNCFNGVPEYLPIPVKTEYKDFNLTIIRPFITSEKDDFKKYIEDHPELKKYIVEDETNSSEIYRRNWLRNTMIPQIHNKGYNLKTIVKKMYNKKPL